MWRRFDLDYPEVGVLIIAKYDFHIGLRRVDEEGNFFDEHDFYDDSGETPSHWHSVPEFNG